MTTSERLVKAEAAKFAVIDDGRVRRICECRFSIQGLVLLAGAQRTFRPVLLAGAQRMPGSRSAISSHRVNTRASHLTRNIEHHALAVESLPIFVASGGTFVADRKRIRMTHPSRRKPLSEAEMNALRARTADDAGDGHFELYKTSTRFDAKVGRDQHGYPSQEELPL